MVWQLTRGGNAKLIHIDPHTDRVSTRIFRTGPIARTAILELHQQRDRNQRAIVEAQVAEAKLNRLEFIADQMIEQHFICSGHIFRHSKWQPVSRLNQPLVPTERNLIRRIKSKVFQKEAMTNNQQALDNFSPRTYLNQEELIVLDQQPVQYECVRKGLDELRTSLLQEGSSPLEVVAIEQIVTNHLQVARSGAELEQIQPSKELASVSNHWIRVHNHAQTRLFRAINTLNRLRKTNMDSVLFKHKSRILDFTTEIAKESVEPVPTPRFKKTDTK